MQPAVLQYNYGTSTNKSTWYSLGAARNADVHTKERYPPIYCFPTGHSSKAKEIFILGREKGCFESCVGGAYIRDFSFLLAAQKEIWNLIGSRKITQLWKEIKSTQCREWSRRCTATEGGKSNISRYINDFNL